MIFQQIISYNYQHISIEFPSVSHWFHHAPIWDIASPRRGRGDPLTGTGVVHSTCPHQKSWRCQMDLDGFWWLLMDFDGIIALLIASSNRICLAICCFQRPTDPISNSSSRATQAFSPAPLCWVQCLSAGSIWRCLASNEAEINWLNQPFYVDVLGV